MCIIINPAGVPSTAENILVQKKSLEKNYLIKFEVSITLYYCIMHL